MSKTDTDTLYETEGRWKPAALVLVCTFHGLALWMLSLSVHALPLIPWTVLCLPCIMLTISNLVCLAKNGPAIGEIPVAVFALAPAALSSALSRPAGSTGWWGFMSLALPCLAFSLVFLIWFARLARATGNVRDVQPDAVLVVLGGLVRDGQPVPTVQERLRVAAELWRESPERMLVLTGGPTPDGSSTESLIMASWIKLEQGVPQTALILEPTALNTQQNLRNAAQLIAERGLGSRQVCVVSSDYHLYRALVMACEAGLEATGIPAPVPPTSRLQQWSREVLVILVKDIR